MEANTIDKIPNGITKVFHASQGDNGRVIRCDLVDGTDIVTLTGNESLVLRYLKMDGSIGSLPIPNTFATKTYVEITIPEELTDTLNRTYCKLRVDGVGYKASYLDIEGRP